MRSSLGLELSSQAGRTHVSDSLRLQNHKAVEEGAEKRCQGAILFPDVGTKLEQGWGHGSVVRALLLW